MVHHRRGLRQLLKNDALVVAVENDWTTAPLGDKRRAMLAFAVKLTITPGAITPDDAQALRDADFSDRDILDITEVVAYYAYANRIADGLGIETETWIT
ncbi:MAG: putative peroxidase-related enzyme [Acidimicrobiales bacterium]